MSNDRGDTSDRDKRDDEVVGLALLVAAAWYRDHADTNPGAERAVLDVFERRFPAEFRKVVMAVFLVQLAHDLGYSGEPVAADIYAFLIGRGVAGLPSLEEWNGDSWASWPLPFVSTDRSSGAA